MVIKPVDDLHTGAVGELPVGEVRLPALVGLVGLESPIGAFGPLLRFRGDQPGGDENTADGGESRWPESFLLQPGRNRDRAVVQSAACSSQRSVQIRSRSAAVTARELLCGRRDRGSTASQPRVW